MPPFGDTDRKVFESNFAQYLEPGEDLVCYVRASDGPPVRWMRFITSFRGWDRLYRWRLVGVTNKRLLILPIGRSWVVNGRPTSVARSDMTVAAHRDLGWIYLMIELKSGQTHRVYVDPSWHRQANKLIEVLGGTVQGDPV